MHSLLESHGWQLEGWNIWDKGVAHIAGRVNPITQKHCPIVTEVCVQYVRRVTVGGLELREWMRREWFRAGFQLRDANPVCGVKTAASVRYLGSELNWDVPTWDRMKRLVEWANEKGREEGKPYYAIDGRVLDESTWRRIKGGAKWRSPGGTNVWRAKPVRKNRRHPNQKPLELMEKIIGAASDEGDMIWEPFGGVFSGSLAAYRLKRKARGAEVVFSHFRAGLRRFS